MFVISSNPNAITMRATSGTKTATQYTKELLINVVGALTVCWIVVLLLELSNPWVSATPFPVLFELCSAFGTVGLSMGFGTSAASLSGAFSIPSKLIVMALMLVGAHRALPDNLDPAVDLRVIPSSAHVIDVPLPNLPAGKRFQTRARAAFFRLPK